MWPFSQVRFEAYRLLAYWHIRRARKLAERALREFPDVPPRDTHYAPYILSHLSSADEYSKAMKEISG